MSLSYRKPGIRLRRLEGANDRMVLDLQRDLRRLGYLATGLDGVFGKKTEQALRALQHDLLFGTKPAKDGQAPVRIAEYNRNRITSADGILDEKLAEVISEMLEDARFPKLPECSNPAEVNRSLIGLIEEHAQEVPKPFLTAILKQESGLRHFSEPSETNADNFVVVGLDRKSGSPAILSRGYGAGQYTLFHHPPTPEEVSEFIANPAGNIRRTAALLREKFLHFVNGSTPDTRADDRIAEFGRGPLRRCRYAPGDPRHLAACRQCLAEAGSTIIQAGATPLYPRAATVYQPTHTHPEKIYRGVPVRARIGCDWPYAVRRYNGSGLNSYHYQAKILLHVLNG